MIGRRFDSSAIPSELLQEEPGITAPALIWNDKEIKTVGQKTGLMAALWRYPEAARWCCFVVLAKYVGFRSKERRMSGGFYVVFGTRGRFLLSMEPQ